MMLPNEYDPDPHEVIANNVRGILEFIDPDPERQSVQETPDRVARMYLKELTSGYDVDIEAIFRTFDNEQYQGMVLVTDIPVRSTCEHHLVPIVGYAHVAYYPRDRVVGLSKLPRLVNAFARRLQVQERLTQQIVDAIDEHLTPRGTAVLIEAEHMCMTVRGVQAPGTRTVTSGMSGVFMGNEDGEKDEFLKLIKRDSKK